MMSKTKTKLQNVVNTKVLLLHAFETYCLKPSHQLNHLTIQQLTKLANVHRLSFYHSFENLLDFIKWYLHHDLILEVEQGIPLTTEKALTAVYQFIDKKRMILIKIFRSHMQSQVVKFIREEALTYQLMNFSRVKTTHAFSLTERKIYANFIAQGITTLIEQYILDDEIAKIPMHEYVLLSSHLIKDYIERIATIRQR